MRAEVAGSWRALQGSDAPTAVCRPGSSSPIHFQSRELPPLGLPGWWLSTGVANEVPVTAGQGVAEGRGACGEAWSALRCQELTPVGVCLALLNTAKEMNWGRKSICEPIFILLQNDSICVPSSQGPGEGGAPGRSAPSLSCSLMEVNPLLGEP